MEQTLPEMQTFDEKFEKTIKEMQQYLLDSKIQRIRFSYTNGWKFSLTCNAKDFQKQLDKSEDF